MIAFEWAVRSAYLTFCAKKYKKLAKTLAKRAWICYNNINEILAAPVVVPLEVWRVFYGKTKKLR